MKLLPSLCIIACISASAQEAASPNQLFPEGVQAFYDAKPKESVAAFNKLISLTTESKPQLWQRGLSLYYAGNYKGGREQFETHQTVNTADVENAAWHFICVARAESVEAARKALIPIEGDTRVPMKQVHELFAGKGSVEDVLKAAESGEGEDLKNQHSPTSSACRRTPPARPAARSWRSPHRDSAFRWRPAPTGSSTA